MTDENKSLKQEIKEHFQYKNFEFNKTDGFLAALLTTSIYLYNIQTVYVFFVYPFWFCAYYGNRFFIILSSILFALFAIIVFLPPMYSVIDYIGNISFLLWAAYYFCRDMWFLYRYKTEHKAELDKKYGIKFMITGFVVTTILTAIWILFYINVTMPSYLPWLAETK